MIRFRLVFIFAAIGVLPSSDRLAADVQVVVDAPLDRPARHALSELISALAQREESVDQREMLSANGPPAIVIGRPRRSPLVDRLLARHELKVPGAPESLLVKKLPQAEPPTVLIAGRDARGLNYALLDVARAIAMAPAEKDWLAFVPEAVESPYLLTRSMTVQIFNADLEREWYYDESYWHGYFATLARNRYNNFSLTFAHQTNYMNPAYPWLLAVPEYPDVQVRGLSDNERKRNLRMFGRIAELAAEHGVDFTFGLWSQRPVPKYGPSNLEKFPEDAAAAGDYCARALALLLKACPAIRGVQFRMNVESGIPEDEQERYFQAQFDAVKNCGRPVRLDIRYKGLAQETIDQAAATGLDLTVSTKYWCEHMGPPYHPAAEDTHYRESRYGYGAMLYHPRNYRVVYRLWSVGSQRLLLWADPDYAARFARSCRFGGGEGFEVFAPLTNKGFGNRPGNWRIFSDPSYEHYGWEYERYWFYYLVFGRLGYNPNCDAGVWGRELAARFGDAAPHVEAAYRQASQIIPLITATRLFAASEWRFWPEMDPGGPLPAYAVVQPSDYGQFYAIKPWQQVEGWVSEPFDSTVRGFVEDAVADRVEGKWTPIQVSKRLKQLADKTLEAISAAHQKLADPQAAEFRSTEVDMHVLAGLARFHAAKLLAATQVEFFYATGESARLSKALDHITEAARAWEEIVRRTDGVYHSDLVFGYDRRRAGHGNDTWHAVETGHWKDRLAEVRADVRYVEQLCQEHPSRGQPPRLYPGEQPPRELPRIAHTPVTRTAPDTPIKIAATISSAVPLRAVLLHFRPMDQTADWQHVEMRSVGGQRYEAEIPAGAIRQRYDLLYYLEARIEGGGVLWPGWQDGLPYVVVPIERAAVRQNDDAQAPDTSACDSHAR